MNYYNEWDSFAADWLRELIKDGLIPDGEVDNRSIADVRPEDLKEFTQCHFFAGIGGWSRALQLAGWSSDRPVWTGSPPCQSFSTAGKGKGKDDERHLWPVFFNLIRECQPPTVFGEQVAAAIRYGWLDDLQIDFEKEGYAAGAFVLPAGGIGAPHKRERLFFVADSNDKRHEWSQEAGREARSGVEHTGSVSMANSGGPGWEGSIRSRSTGEERESERHSSERSGDSSVGNSDSNRPQSRHEAAETAGHGNTSDPASLRAKLLVNSNARRHNTKKEQIRAGRELTIVPELTSFWSESVGNSEHNGSHEAEIGRSTGSGEAESGMLESKRPDSLFWGSSEVIYCRDGKYRPIPTEPALFPLANGISNRVGLLRGAGNAIVPQAAAEIIKAYLS
jgi:DNA (cytosine-5)-methyltransferase 1